MPRHLASASARKEVSAASSGSGVCSSSMNWPNSDSSSSPTGFSRETGVCDVRRIDSTSSTLMSSSAAISSFVGARPRHRLTDPPGRVGRELVALAPVELLGGTDQTDRPLLDQIQERQTLVPVALRDRHDEPQVGFDHLLLRAVIAPLD